MNSDNQWTGLIGVIAFFAMASVAMSTPNIAVGIIGIVILLWGVGLRPHDGENDDLFEPEPLIWAIIVAVAMVYVVLGG